MSIGTTDIEAVAITHGLDHSDVIPAVEILFKGKKKRIKNDVNYVSSDHLTST